MATIGFDPSPCNITKLRSTMGINGPQVSECNLHLRLADEGIIFNIQNMHQMSHTEPTLW